MPVKTLAIAPESSRQRSRVLSATTQRDTHPSLTLASARQGRQPAHSEGQVSREGRVITTSQPQVVGQDPASDGQPREMPHRESPTAAVAEVVTENSSLQGEAANQQQRTDGAEIAEAEPATDATPISANEVRQTEQAGAAQNSRQTQSQQNSAVLSTAHQNTASQSAATQNIAHQNTVHQNTAPQNTAPQNAVPANAAPATNGLQAVLQPQGQTHREQPTSEQAAALAKVNDVKVIKPHSGAADLPASAHQPKEKDEQQSETAKPGAKEAGAEQSAQVTVKLPAEVSAPPAVAAKIAPLALSGASDNVVQQFSSASPSQMAVNAAKLGTNVSASLTSEHQKEVKNVPVLKVDLKGKQPVKQKAGTEQTTPQDIASGVTAPNPTPAVPTPHKDKAPAPNNSASLKQLDAEPSRKGMNFWEWLKAKVLSLTANIKTTDPGVNTKAGSAKKVALKGEADPDRVVRQRSDARRQVSTKQQALVSSIKANPGQDKIQPKTVQQDCSVVMVTPAPAPLVTASNSHLTDYASAVIPAEVREKADQTLKQKMNARLDKARVQTKQAVSKRDGDKGKALQQAKTKTAAINQQAEARQRQQVLDNRKQVAAEQRAGIAETNKQLKQFDQEASKEQSSVDSAVKAKVKGAEKGAADTLKKAEQDADKRKQQGEADAAVKKKQLKKAQKKKSWWQKVKGAIKSAVKAISKAIDVVFTKMRQAVKFIIDKAKNAAIGLINKARKWVVDKLNKFRDWAKKQVTRYIGKLFPKLAKAINKLIDKVVDKAVKAVNAIADKAIAGVKAVAGFIGKALDKILAVFQTALKAAVQIVGAVLTGDFTEALKIAIRAACDIAGISPKPIFDFINRAASKVVPILVNPDKFIKNLCKAVGMGLRNFVKHIRVHLVSGLVSWLTGAMSSVPITLPKKFDAKGVFSLVRQVMGLTWENLKARIIKRFPAAAGVMEGIAKGVTIIHQLVTKGPGVLWEMVKEKLANLKQMVMSEIRKFVIFRLIEAGISWLLGMLNPIGALYKVLKLLFDLVMFFVRNFQRIKAFILSIYGAITSIAAGVLTKAAKAVEGSLARIIPIAISFLASLLNLGGLAGMIQGIIKTAAKPVTRLFDFLVDKAVAVGKRLLKGGKKVAKKVVSKLVAWWKAKKSFKANNGETHTLLFKGQGNSAVLVMRSEEHTYSSFLNSLSPADLKPKQITRLNKAKVIAANIDRTRKELSSAKSDAVKKAKSREINGLLTQLSVKTASLFGGTPKCGQIKFGGVNTAGFGKSMSIQPLTNRDAPKGSRPDLPPTAVYKNLNLRRHPTNPGKASFYVRGHLLNQKLGGTGKEWKNLTPLSQSGNHQHEVQAESYVKKGVSAGATMQYSVTPKYSSGHPGGNALKSSLQEAYPAHAAEFASIVDAEVHVPISLSVTASVLKRKGKGYTELSKKSWSINNPIQPTVDRYAVKSMSKLVPVALNPLTSTKPLTDQPGKPISADQAIAILLAVEEKRKSSTKGKGFASYNALATVAADIEPSVNLNQLTTWRKQNYIRLR
ncbi:DNA/RNA non-specific endonuclease [Corallincola holothuriorum]|nr:DNA/RNA non-specific endonuclease [Corallincola holothuriorum]